MLAGEFKNNFELDRKECEALISIQYWIVLRSLDKRTTLLTPDRIAWLNKWTEDVFQKKWFGLADSKPKSESDVIKRITTVKGDLKKKIVLLEARLFVPFFNLGDRKVANVALAENRELEAYASIQIETLQSICSKIGISNEEISLAVEKYEEALKEIANRGTFTKKAGLILLATAALAATGGWAAPALGTWVGGMMGLYGVAATSAGLAFLGGGALAAGGAGMAGGALVVIGGGALLGASSSALFVNRNIFFQHKLILQQLAKMQAILFVFCKNDPNFRDQLMYVYDEYIKMRNQLKTEENDESLSDEERSSLKKTIVLYKNAAEIIDDRRRTNDLES